MSDIPDEAVEPVQVRQNQRMVGGNVLPRVGRGYAEALVNYVDRLSGRVEAAREIVEKMRSVTPGDMGVPAFMFATAGLQAALSDEGKPDE